MNEAEGKLSKREQLCEVEVELKTVKVELSQLLARQRELERKRDALERSVRAEEAEMKRSGIDWSDDAAFPWRDEVVAASALFGVTEFRPCQKEAINCLLARNDCFVVMPTGGGKSLCFLVPAIVSVGVTVVVSPLVALMHDQKMALDDAGVKAAMLCSGMQHEESNKVYEALASPTESGLKLLFVTPEKISSSKKLITRLQSLNSESKLAMFVVDECHCCSQWGHDFRPDYAKLGMLKRLFQKVPIAALTATATTRVFDDVCGILGIDGCALFRTSFNRPNLMFEVVRKSSRQSDAMVQLTGIIKSRFSGMSGIVYVFSRKDADNVASELRKSGIKAESYHSSTDPSERKALHRKWCKDEIQVVVATIAFGLGINKLNVRFVIHLTLPKSIECLSAYYQEAGRAGRDGAEASCILMFNPADVTKQSSMVCFERGGLRCLRGCVLYCLNRSHCRRVLMSEHFGESVDPAVDCKGHCDVCSGQAGSYETIDVVPHAKTILSVLAEQTKKPTHIQLVEAWMSCPSSKVPKSWDRDSCLEILLKLVAEDVLSEEFAQSMYSVNVYLTKGPQADAIHDGILTDIVADVPLSDTTRQKSPPAKRGRSPSLKKTDAKKPRNDSTEPKDDTLTNE